MAASFQIFHLLLTYLTVPCLIDLTVDHSKESQICFNK